MALPRHLVGSIAFTIVLTLFLTSLHWASAQSTARAWTPPLNLFETEGRASEAEVVADPSGAVHVVWAYGGNAVEDSGAAQAIYYARKDGSAWSEPVDVLVSPGGRGARMPSIAADAAGYLHVAWSGGNALFYSRAHAASAGAARGWTSPYALTSGVSALEPAVAVDNDGTVYVAWTQALAGLMLARSDDGGQTWAVPQTVFPADRDNELARWGRIAVDGAGRLHVVLTYTVNDPTAQYGRTDANLLYYLRSTDRGDTWSEPLLVTPEPDFGEINVATFGEDVVHLVWNGRAGRHGRYHRWSEDGGTTWRDRVEVLAPSPQNPIGDGGLTGFPALATDATGTLHMVSATGGGDYYFRWSEGAWLPPLLISPGLDGFGVTKTTASLEQPSIAISEGNLLHVVFHDGFERIWYTGVVIEAPHVAPQALTVPGPLPEATEESSAAATAASTTGPEAVSVVAAAPDSAPSPSTMSQSQIILLSIAPALLLVLVIIVRSRLRKGRNG